MELMTLDEVATFMRIEKRTLHNWMSTGKFPRKEISICLPRTRTRVFVKEKLIQFLEKCMQEAAAQIPA